MWTIFKDSINTVTFMNYHKSNIGLYRHSLINLSMYVLKDYTWRQYKRYLDLKMILTTDKCLQHLLVVMERHNENNKKGYKVTTKN